MGASRRYKHVPVLWTGTSPVAHPQRLVRLRRNHMDVRHGCGPVGMTKKARRALRYPTQAKTGLEWGTQPLLKVKQSKKVTTSRDDNSEGRLKVIQLGI